MLHFLLFTFICLAWGISFLLMKYATISFGALSISCYRVLAGGSLLFLLWYLRPKAGRQLHFKRDFIGLTLIAFLGNALPFFLQPYLIGIIKNSGFIGMMVAFVPLLTMISSVFMLKHRPSRLEIGGVGGGLLLLTVILYESLQFNFPLFVLVLALVTPLSYALTNTYIKKKYSTVCPTALSCFTLLYAGLMLLPLCLTEDISSEHEKFNLALTSLLVLGIVSTGLAIVAFYYLIKERGPLFASMVTYIIPLEAVLLGWWLENEQISFLQILCLFGVIILVAITNLYPVKRKQALKVES